MPKASPHAIRNLATAIDGLRTAFAEKVKNVGTTTIVAGAFTEADELETAVRNGATSLGKEVANVDTALTHIVTNLNTNAQLYADAEENNEAAGTALNGLIIQLDDVFDPDADDSR